MPKTYYTITGQIIRNPEAYAATGAPMYKTKYSNSKDINEEKDIYKLKLKNNKIYVGMTGDIEKRMEQHFSGNGSKVTKKFKPIKGKIIDSCPGYFAEEIEQYHTEEYIDKYGYGNVRGGKYTNSKTLKNKYKNYYY
tara:strand:- start:130 stop:540 length:411 start_codon:yes stop_codon:yes gene_type:complete